MPSGLRIKHTLKRCNLHLHNGGALVNMNGLSSLMCLSDKDQNKCFSFFLFSFLREKPPTCTNVVSPHPSQYSLSTPIVNVSSLILNGRPCHSRCSLCSCVCFFPLSLPAASFQLHVAGCPPNGSWHMWPKCKSDSDFPFKWAPRGICTRPPL